MTGGYLRVDEQTTLVSKAKMGLLEETLDDLLEAGKKVVVFARFIPEIEAITKMLDKRKLPTGSFMVLPRWMRVAAWLMLFRLIRK